MVFQPSLDQDHTDGFYNMVDGLLDEIFRFASLVPRVATHLETPDYHTDVEEVGKLMYMWSYLYACTESEREDHIPSS